MLPALSLSLTHAGHLGSEAAGVAGADGAGAGGSALGRGRVRGGEREGEGIVCGGVEGLAQQVSRSAGSALGGMLKEMCEDV